MNIAEHSFILCILVGRKSSFKQTVPALVTTRRNTLLLVTVACLDNLRNTSALLLDAIDLCTVLDLDEDMG